MNVFDFISLNNPLSEPLNRLSNRTTSSSACRNRLNSRASIHISSQGESHAPFGSLNFVLLDEVSSPVSLKRSNFRGTFQSLLSTSFSFLRCPVYRELPKSIIFAVPEESTWILSDFMSQCISRCS